MIGLKHFKDNYGFKGRLKKFHQNNIFEKSNLPFEMTQPLIQNFLFSLGNYYMISPAIYAFYVFPKSNTP